MPAREELHRVVDELSDADIELLLLYLRTRDPLVRALLLAPADDEPETEEERAAVEEAYEALARGEVVSDDDLRRELGL